MSWEDAQGTIHRFDLAFVCVHGHPGEDGHLQGYFHSIGLPVAGSNVFSSALTFNKAHTHSFARTIGIDVPASVLYRKAATGAMNWPPICPTLFCQTQSLWKQFWDQPCDPGIRSSATVKRL